MGQLCELICGGQTIPSGHPSSYSQSNNNQQNNWAVGAGNLNQPQQLQQINAQNQQQQSWSGGTQQNQQKESWELDVICRSTISNISQQCTYSNPEKTQVKNCIFCQFGVINDTCMTSPTSWWDAHEVFMFTYLQWLQGVSPTFRTLTIILACLLGLVVLILGLVCVFIIM
jgi:hypothetical protein